MGLDPREPLPSALTEDVPPGMIVDIRQRKIYPGVKLTEQMCETIWADIQRAVNRGE